MFPTTIHPIVCKPCPFIYESVLRVYALDLHPSIDQAQIRLIQKICPYQEDVGRKNEGQIQALISGSNPCFHSCVLAHVVAMRKVPPALPTGPRRKK